jgi:hypothetical protein
VKRSNVKNMPIGVFVSKLVVALNEGSTRLDDRGLKNYLQAQADRVINSAIAGRSVRLDNLRLQAAQIALNKRGLK